MDIELLVEQIVREVLKKLSLRSNGINSLQNSNAKKALLAILPRHVFNLDKYVEYLADTYSDHSITLMAPKAMHERFDGIEAIDNTADIDSEVCVGNIIDDFDRYEAVYCIAPGIKLMESIAALDDTDITAYLIINGLLRKKKTVFINDCIFSGSAEGPINKKVRELMEEIDDLGIEIEFIGSLNQAEYKLEAKERDLITEQDVIKLWNEGVREIVINKGAMITPLAIDKAKEKGMKILI